ncbi:MAG TPA: class I SAM-dependent methyltransferase [Prosthecobacter sp.]|nr:class I SAM-dependent methyltransferase [Prosthecobacter sp.]HRK13193.1 class I SAM-dependent methyltransferase [Prosthecobacter sp.]
MNSLGSLLLPKSLHERMQVERWHVHDFIRREALPLMKPGMKVLDAGSGKLPEQYLRGEILDTGATLHTCDLNFGPGVDYEADVSAMPFDDGCYDIVLNTQVLEHVKDPGRVCKELARVLKPGGLLFLTTPQSSPLHNLPWNFFNFTNLGLGLLMDAAGLERVKVQPQGGHFALLAFELHWTVREIRRSSMPPLLKAPLQLAAQALFGFALKLLLIWLDRFDRDPLNTMGWNLMCRKPDAPATPGA